MIVDGRLRYHRTGLEVPVSVKCKGQDTKEAHGEPLGEEEIRGAKRAYGWLEDAKFLVPEGVREHFASIMGKRGHDLRTAWDAMFAQYTKTSPALADQVTRMQHRELPDGWDKNLPVFPADPKGLASRDSSGKLASAWSSSSANSCAMT